VVMLDGKGVGRLWVAQDEFQFTLVDIAIHPSVQSKGIGSALIQRLQQESARARLPIHCMVSRFNPGSLRFHKRLGFSIIREDQVHYYLEWRTVALI